MIDNKYQLMEMLNTVVDDLVGNDDHPGETTIPELCACVPNNRSKSMVEELIQRLEDTQGKIEGLKKLLRVELKKRQKLYYNTKSSK